MQKTEADISSIPHETDKPGRERKNPAYRESCRAAIPDILPPFSPSPPQTLRHRGCERQALFFFVSSVLRTSQRFVSCANFFLSRVQKVHTLCGSESVSLCSLFRVFRGALYETVAEQKLRDGPPTPSSALLAPVLCPLFLAVPMPSVVPSVLASC